jgi:hypothetical protein
MFEKKVLREVFGHKDRLEVISERNIVISPGIFRLEFKEFMIG